MKRFISEDDIERACIENGHIKTDTKIILWLRLLPTFAAGDYQSCTPAEGCAGADANRWK
jgi:hypothetical protein